MSKGGIAVLIVAAAVFALLGFAFGQVVQAADKGLGNQHLVTETYVQKYVGEVVAELQAHIDELDLRLKGGAVGGEVDPAIPEPPGEPDDAVAATAPPTPDTAATPAPTTVKIKSSGVNIRSDASTSASIVSSVAANTVLTYLGQKNDSQGQVWYQVRLSSNGTEGWVASWLCYEPE